MATTASTDMIDQLINLVRKDQELFKTLSTTTTTTTTATTATTSMVEKWTEKLFLENQILELFQTLPNPVTTANNTATSNTTENVMDLDTMSLEKGEILGKLEKIQGLLRDTRHLHLLSTLLCNGLKEMYDET